MRPLPIALIVAAVAQLGATDCGQVIRDSGFDLWCEDELCAWKVTRGDVRKVPTWNEGDLGVELLGDDTAIQQLSPVTSNDGTCIHFHLISNIDDTLDVFLDVDVQGDGSVERRERIPTSHWKPISFYVLVTAPYDGIRFEIAKQGRGTAVLANIGAELASGECAGLTPLDPGPRRNGALCTEHAQCSSGVCSGFQCVGCDATHACTGGDVCGAGIPLSPVFPIPTECVAAADKLLGEHCIVDGECASAICDANTCARCRGGSCPPAASGEPCGDHLDCASGTCVGPDRSQCDDGRTCTSAAQCPFETGLKNGPCTTVGIEGGVCQ